MEIIKKDPWRMKYIECVHEEVYAEWLTMN